MIRAIRINMVNRALQDRGHWWTPFFHNWCEEAGQGLFRGVDGLLQSTHEVKTLAERIPSSFWAAALKDWASMQYRMPTETEPTLHREAVGATPVLARSLSKKDRYHQSDTTQLLTRSKLIYLSDIFDMSRLHWCSEEALRAALEPHATTADQLEHAVEWCRRWFRRLSRPRSPFAQAVDALSTNREEAAPKDGPCVGDIWADPSSQPMVVGKVVHINPETSGPQEQNGPDRDACVCMDPLGSQGDCITLAALPHSEGAGVRDKVTEGQGPAVVVCSCNLTPVHSTDDHLYGPMSLTALSPPALTALSAVQPADSPPLTLTASIRRLRSHILQCATPRRLQHQQPTAQIKWAAELGLHNFGIEAYDQAKLRPSQEAMREKLAQHPHPPPPQLITVLSTEAATWGERWRSINQVQLSGPIRSFLYRLTHRSLPLLTNPWLAQYYGRDPHCILCNQTAPETYSHLFSGCEVARSIWEQIEPITLLLLPLLTPQLDPRPARLVGDLSQADSSRILEGWPSGAQRKPSHSQISHWTRTAWNEVRATVMHSIWVNRCSLLAGAITKEVAIAQAKSRCDALLRALAYAKLPSTLKGMRSAEPTPQRQYYFQTWGRVAHLLLLPRHRTSTD